MILIIDLYAALDFAASFTSRTAIFIATTNDSPSLYTVTNASRLNQILTNLVNNIANDRMSGC